MLYTTYRPQTYKEVSGQEENLITLRGYVSSGKYPSANLFAGHRGTGKTTIARITARVICCTSPTEDGPCNQCKNCQSILNNTTHDYIELDAASHNTINDIKELVSSTSYLPMVLPKKIYIIDEVHNLSGSAFDALLKTIEEPPAHCIFILCTTELHKIPSTIKSRCAIYQFNSLSIDIICEKLICILKDLNKDYEADAVSMVAKQADGSLRDALSILERLIISTDILSIEHVKKVLCLMDDEITLKILSSVFNEKGKEAIIDLQRLHEEGKSLPLLVDNILQSLTDAIILISSSFTAKIYNSEDYVNDLKCIIETVDLDLLFWLTDQFSLLREKIRNSINPYMDVQLQLIKCCNPDILNDSKRAVVKRIGTAEKEISLINKRLDSFNSNITEKIYIETPVINQHEVEEENIILPGSIMEQEEVDKNLGLEDCDHLFINDIPPENETDLESKTDDHEKKEEDQQKDDSILDLFGGYL